MARRFARRKRPRVAWMPTFGGAPVPESATAPWPGVEAELHLDGATEFDGVIWDAIPLTFDVSEGAVNAQADPTKVTLHDIVTGNEWRLRRIVGKAFIAATRDTAIGAGTTHLIDVALGFIVCRTDDDGTPITNFDEVNPLSQESMEDPWIWRRRWLLNPWSGTIVNPETPTSLLPYAWNSVPMSNIACGSVADGPHIDSKSNRIIHRSERLYAVLACRRYGPTSENYPGTGIYMLLDYRLVGSLRAAAYGNRRNTSR